MVGNRGLFSAGAPSAADRHLAEMLDCVPIPPSKSLHNEGDKVDALGTAAIIMSPIFGGFAGGDGSARMQGCLVKERDLDGGDDGDVKSSSAPILPHWDEDVGWS